ncbi:two-component response regulator ORR3-like isoform X2 [Carica papaya]|uniref:two-component response regulator ORR3-like isoform X2 n=1 Tax=Carica papaya TaxID=3649 RepID=UPI000B8C800B|nr:two-component response regulator ORR3-like isoform X2 [Carica papaya]
MASSSFASSSSDHKPHVLAVDDSFVDRKLIEKLLIKSACKVTTAVNGREALEFLGLANGQHPTNNDVNLIVTDYCMPEMTGYELLKRESPTMKEIPVVILSSENNPHRIEQCLEEGANEYMLKPLRQQDVKKLKCHMKEFKNPCKVLCFRKMKN